MLKEITIENFRSINNPVTLSMDADINRVSEFNNHIEKIRNNNLLKICSMYGPNGGGKSNLIYALVTLNKLVKSGKISIGSFNRNLSCVFNDSKIVSFKVFFTGKKYDLAYVVKFKEGDDSNLTEGDRMHRKRFEISFNILFEEVYILKNGEYNLLCKRNEIGKIDSNNKYLKYLFKQKIGSSLSLLRYVYENFYNENEEEYSNEKKEEGYEALLDLFNEINSIYSIHTGTLNAISVIDKNKDRIIKLLNYSDIKIKDILLERSEDDYQIYFVREIKLNKKTITKKINFYDESNGTCKLFNIIISLLSKENNGAIFLGDDLNAYLHPKLLSAVIEIITSENNHNIQLIFNSHDFINMTNKLFRRDEIWFAYRDEAYQTNLIPLSNITNYKGKQIRNDAIYSKQYIAGKFGADPFIEKGLNWDEK